jgi:hypothetical protein
MKRPYRTAWTASLLVLSFQSGVRAEDEHADRARAEKLAGYVIEKVADTGTPVPAGTGNFVSLGVPCINGGTIAFRGDGGAGQKGVYALVGGTLTKVADLNTPVPGGPGNFTFFSAASLYGNLSVASDGGVAFIGKSTAGTGVYTNSAGPLSILVDETFPVPRNPAGQFVNFFHISYDGGQVAVTALSDGFLEGLYLADGSTVSLVADQGTPIPGGTGQFTTFGLSAFAGYPSLHAGDVVFTGLGELHQSGVYGRLGGVLTVIADQNTFVPGTTTPFLGSFARDSNSRAVIRDGHVAFQNGGIYVDRGSGLETVADYTTPMPGSLTRFNSFGPPAIDGGKVAFSGQRFFRFPPYVVYLTKSGLFTDIQGPLRSVAARSLFNPIDGKLVAEVLSGTEALSDGSFAFKVIFFGGSEGVYVARPM